MNPLSSAEAGWVHSLARHSTHPHAMRISQALAGTEGAETVLSFVETAGRGIEGSVGGHDLLLGSAGWLRDLGMAIPAFWLPALPMVCLAIDGKFRGAFILENALRPNVSRLLRHLAGRYSLALLSGDNQTERQRFSELFGTGNSRLLFNQSPLDKLQFIASLQKAGNNVMMVGDGLNDAGALKQSQVGVAVVDKIGSFSPASDVILSASQVPHLDESLTLARRTARIVRLSFAISASYNLIGVTIAAAGLLSPIICAVLMPLSSISVVLFACGATRWAGRGLDSQTIHGR